MIDKLDKIEDLIEAERQIARGEVYSHETAKRKSKKTWTQVTRQVIWTRQAIRMVNEFVDYIAGRLILRMSVHPPEFLAFHFLY